MDRAVLFRFHRAPDVCRANLELVRALNPGVPVYGLGERIGIADALDGLHVVAEHDDFDPASYPEDWHWRHGDQPIAHWYQHVGRDLDVDQVVVLEWDLLLAAPLGDLYAHVPADGVALSGLLPIEDAREEGWAWLTRGDSPEEYPAIREHVAEALGQDDPAPACVFPGAALPTGFLDEYAARDPPLLCNDEVRLPLYAQALGYDLHDTGFYEWREESYRYFNCRGIEIPRDRVIDELRAEDGRRAFHPVRDAETFHAVRERVA